MTDVLQLLTERPAEPVPAPPQSLPDRAAACLDTAAFAAEQLARLAGQMATTMRQQPDDLANLQTLNDLMRIAWDMAADNYNARNAILSCQGEG